MKRSVAAIVLAAILTRVALLGAGTGDGDLIRGLMDSDRTIRTTYRVEAVSGGTGRPVVRAGAVKRATATPSPEPAQLAANGAELRPTTIAGGALAINNATAFEVDAAALMAEELELRLPSQGCQVLIIHTHGSEAYSPTALDAYEASDLFRTQDERYSVIRVGDELAAALEEQGLSVIHDRGVYDYPSYTGSYGRSLEAAEAHFASYPETAVVIDLHRDALGDDEVVYKTVSAVSGESSAQLMLVVGTGENGLEHPRWRENLKLALHMQDAMCGSFPTLARPIALKRERYNQQLCDGALILEVGSSGNTLSEALCAVRLFASSVAPLLLSLREGSQ